MPKHNYVHLLVSIVHCAADGAASAINRYCVGISTEDSRMLRFDLDNWATPENRGLLLSLLCEDWLTDGCTVVGCEQVAGAVQWEAIHG